MNIQTYLTNIALFLDQTAMPFIIALAGLFFIWNAVRYFIIGGANPDDQEKARTLALWGILAFVIIVSVWGIVRLMVSSLNLGDLERPITPDYMQQKGGSVNNGRGQGSTNDTYPDNDEGYRLPGIYNDPASDNP